MNVKVLDDVTGQFREAAWALYSEAFKELNALAVQRHLMYRNEFDDVMRDPRVQKYLYLDSHGTLRGVSIYSSEPGTAEADGVPYHQIGRQWPVRRRAVVLSGLAALVATVGAIKAIRSGLGSVLPADGVPPLGVHTNVAVPFFGVAASLPLVLAAVWRVERRPVNTLSSIRSRLRCASVVVARW